MAPAEVKVGTSVSIDGPSPISEPEPTRVAVKAPPVQPPAWIPTPAGRPTPSAQAGEYVASPFQGDRIIGGSLYFLALLGFLSSVGLMGAPNFSFLSLLLSLGAVAGGDFLRRNYAWGFYITIGVGFLGAIMTLFMHHHSYLYLFALTEMGIAGYAAMRVAGQLGPPPLQGVPYLPGADAIRLSPDRGTTRFFGGAGPRQETVKVKCPKCSAINSESARFCNNCGGPL